ncbi:MAG: SHOCT domain-containing protein [Spirochaetota bacterium]
MVIWFLIIVVVALIVYIIVIAQKSAAKGGQQESPLEIAKRRYAQGEISREEFERIKRDLI